MSPSQYLPSWLLALWHLCAAPFPRPASALFPFKWLVAPSLPKLWFAVRTTIAALLALGIALWMELDSPHWAVMAVWIAAQPSRGETRSKSRWQLVGNLVGTAMGFVILIAFPQETWLFIPTLALWMGLCSGVATFVRNFRSYGVVLCGYVCAIIAIDSLNNPHSIFDIAVARGTYITLGLLSEMLVSSLFTYNLEKISRQRLAQDLLSAISDASLAIADILANESNADTRSHELFATITGFSNRVEFNELEMGPHHHEGDHARAALSAILLLLSRGLGLSVRLKMLDPENNLTSFEAIRREVRDYLREMPQLLWAQRDVRPTLERIHALRVICRRHIIDVLNHEMRESSGQDEEEAVSHLNSRILHTSLDDILGDLEEAIMEFNASQHTSRKDRFQFRPKTTHNLSEAACNGARVVCAVILGGLICEVTAWPSGASFLSFMCMTCGRFSASDNPSSLCKKYLQGALIATALAFVLDLYVLPRPTDFAILALCLTPFMIVGGLLSYTPATRTMGIGINVFVPVMIQPGNQSRINEISLFNLAMAIIVGIVLADFVFRTILPFNPMVERQELRHRILRDLRQLAVDSPLPQAQMWIAQTVERFVRLLQHSNALPKDILAVYVHGTLSAMTVGLNIMRLRAIIKREQLPPNTQKAIHVVLRRMSRFTGKHGRTARIARSAVSKIRMDEIKEENLTVRIEMTRAIAYLIVIAYELEENASFLDPSFQTETNRNRKKRSFFLPLR